MVYLLYAGDTEDAVIKEDVKRDSPEAALEDYAVEKGEITLNADGKRHNQAFSFAAVPNGSYKLAIFKPGKYVPKIVTVTVDSADADLGEINLWLKGDVTGDGKVNIGDVRRLSAHVMGTNPLTDPDAIIVADVTEDGKVNIGDVRRLSAHIMGTNPFTE